MLLFFLLMEPNLGEISALFWVVSLKVTLGFVVRYGFLMEFALLAFLWDGDDGLFDGGDGERACFLVGRGGCSVGCVGDFC